MSVGMMMPKNGKQSKNRVKDCETEGCDDPVPYHSKFTLCPKCRKLHKTSLRRIFTGGNGGAQFYLPSMTNRKKKIVDTSKQALAWANS